MSILGYGSIYRCDKTVNGGGILAAVKYDIKTSAMKTYKQDKSGQGLWMLIDSKNTRIELGVVYAPQANTTPNKELKKMYSAIKQQIGKPKQQKQNILIVGDFNAKNYDKNKR